MPYLLVGPFAGVIVDRAQLNRVLVLSNVGRGVMTAALFFAPSWPLLMVLIFMRGVVDTFFTPAKQAAIQALATPDARMRANGISHAINQASKIVAPALGGALLIWLAPQTIFLANAVVSFCGAALLLRMPAIARANHSNDPPGPMMQNIKEGLSEVRGSAVLRAALTMMGAGYFAMFFYDTLIAPLTQALGFSQAVLGLALAAVGAGGVLGAVALGMRETTMRPFLMVAIGSGVAAVMVTALGLFDLGRIAVGVWAYLALFAVLGLCTAMTVVPFRTLIQDHAAPDRIGRVTAFSEAINTCALLTAPFIGAIIAARFSFGAAFVAGGLVMLGVALRAFALRDIG